MSYVQPQAIEKMSPFVPLSFFLPMHHFHCYSSSFTVVYIDFASPTFQVTEGAGGEVCLVLAQADLPIESDIRVAIFSE
jgi:hypothetical protein